MKGIEGIRSDREIGCSSGVSSCFHEKIISHKTLNKGHQSSNTLSYSKTYILTTKINTNITNFVWSPSRERLQSECKPRDSSQNLETVSGPCIRCGLADSIEQFWLQYYPFTPQCLAINVNDLGFHLQVVLLMQEALDRLEEYNFSAVFWHVFKCTQWFRMRKLGIIRTKLSKVQKDKGWGRGGDSYNGKLRRMTRYFMRW